MKNPSPSADEAAPPDWAALIHLYDRAVFVSLLASGVRPLAARELCHDTWSRLYEQWRAGRLELLQLPGLAIAQARFLALQSARRRSEADLDEANEHADPRTGPFERALARQLVAKVERALEACPPRARELFELALENPDVPQAELAQRSGISLQRLRQSLCEVRARLRAQVDGAATDLPGSADVSAVFGAGAVGLSRSGEEGP